MTWLFSRWKPRYNSTPTSFQFVCQTTTRTSLEEWPPSLVGDVSSTVSIPRSSLLAFLVLRQVRLSYKLQKCCRWWRSINSAGSASANHGELSVPGDVPDNGTHEKNIGQLLVRRICQRAKGLVRGIYIRLINSPSNFFNQGTKSYIRFSGSPYTSMYLIKFN